ncbi:hypothetical protein PNBC_20700 [Paenibacillus crassostreae]|uniref:Uncharacterized protein n=1 Tax=Paenibacillus crassostreae TaxID=1763538 RepID=A0A167AG93_9BACL|nr:hypothetical protein [Paenibacillus crassostreae]AOZ92269.1 hypothetical protein LPB68_08550 [Paenibacillus crassostreae]OAB70986.1 hypothetical protein PNBC_20700 [Paenibacillus crassostreae]
MNYCHTWLNVREREKINGRQAEGIATALNNGVKFGRPKQIINDEFKRAYEEWKNGNTPPTLYCPTSFD